VRSTDEGPTVRVTVRGERETGKKGGGKWKSAGPSRSPRSHVVCETLRPGWSLLLVCQKHEEKRGCFWEPYRWFNDRCSTIAESMNSPSDGQGGFVVRLPMSIPQSGNTVTALAARFSPGDRGKAVSSSMGRKKKTQKSQKIRGLDQGRQPSIWPRSLARNSIPVDASGRAYHNPSRGT